MGRGRKSKQVINAEINRIRRYIEENLDKSDHEIIQGLTIKERTFYDYKQKIREQDKEVWKEMAKEDLDIKAMKIQKALNYCEKVNRSIAENSADDRAKIEATKKIVEAAIMSYQLIEKGPIKTIFIDATKLADNNESKSLESVTGY